jgi:hypothetical protein
MLRCRNKTLRFLFDSPPSQHIRMPVIIPSLLNERIEYIMKERYLEEKRIKHLLCPISGELMRNPVVRCLV